VRWKTRPDDLAALVTDSGADRLAAELFHFGDGPRAMEAELFLLGPGHYGWSLAGAAGREIATSSLEVSSERPTIRFALPPRELCTLTIEPPPGEREQQ
jgi:hypothetical protein